MISTQKTVLVVEDDHAIRDIFVQILENEGYGVMVASNGQEAIDCLSKGFLPHLITLDLMMPVMDGMTFRREQLKNNAWADIPVIIMSADGHVKEKLEQVGGKAYLKKPLDIDVLVNTVSQYIN